MPDCSPKKGNDRPEHPLEGLVGSGAAPDQGACREAQQTRIWRRYGRWRNESALNDTPADDRGRRLARARPGARRAWEARTDPRR